MNGTTGSRRGAGDGGRNRSPFRFLPLVLGLGLWVSACGGGGSMVPPPAGGPPPPGAAVPPPPSGGSYNVTIHNRTGQFLVDNLELEFNRRRGIRAFYGFRQNAYHDLVTVSFLDCIRVDFSGMMPTQLFEEAMVGREDLNLSPDVAFELRLTYRDQRQEIFYALIPKLRGIFDFKPWEVGMAGNSLGIQYVEFNR